jgi:cell division protein FtsW (lipid II flippase)
MKRSFFVTLKRRHLDFGLSAFAVCLGVWLQIYLNGTSWMKKSAAPINNPGFFPDLIAKALVIVGIALLLQTLVLRRHDTSSVTVNLWAFGILVVWTAYAMIMPRLGFIISSMLVVAVSMVIWGVKKKKTIVLCSVIAPVVLYLILGVALKVKFPTLFL